MDVTRLIRRAATNFGDAPAVLADHRTMSFKEFDDITERVGNALLAEGLKPGDRVGILLPNGVDVVLAYYALAKAGLVRVALNLKDTPEDHLYKLTDSESIALITTVTGFEKIGLVLSPEGMYHLADDVDPNPSEHRWGADDLYRIGYTGGTTGRPKGVLLTHGIEMALLRNYLLDLLPDIRPGDRMLHAAPMTHATGSFFLPHLVRGASNTVMERFDPSDLIGLLRDLDPTCMFLVPTMISLLVDHPDITPSVAPSLRRLCYGASPIAPSVAGKATSIFGPVLAQTYGQSEAPMTITYLPPEEHHRVGSAGRPYTFVEVEIHDDAGQCLDVDEQGEVVVRGDIVTPGYHNRPEASAAALRGGWLHTGDLGRFDEDGFLYLLDRKNDLIVSGGYNVYPREVEDVLMAHPAVIEAAVVGVPHDRWGQVVHAVVSVTGDVTEAELLEHASALLASYKKPRTVEIWDRLPKSPAGKILRREVLASVAETKEEP